MERGAPLQVRDRSMLEDLSFALFCAWLFGSVFAMRTGRMPMAAVPIGGETGPAVLAFGFDGSRWLAPGAQAIFIDSEYLRCWADVRSAASISGAERRLCPVLNKIRYNLGSRSASSVVGSIPPTGHACCESGKQRLWKFLRSASDDVLSASLGARVVRLGDRLTFDRLLQYIGGGEIGTSDLGKMFEETLLLLAGAAAGALYGAAHCELVEPYPTYELDFVIWQTRGARPRKKTDKPPPDWGSYLRDKAACVFEITLGHRESVDDRSQPGMDHPTNKALNFLSLASMGFDRFEYHYVSVLGPHENLNATILGTMRGAGAIGFNYHCVADTYSDLSEKVVSYLDQPVSHAQLHDWHEDTAGAAHIDPFLVAG